MLYNMYFKYLDIIFTILFYQLDRVSFMNDCRPLILKYCQGVKNLTNMYSTPLLNMQLQLSITNKLS